MERQLVTIRTVKEIRPIEGADAIEIAAIDGWQCVVKKGEFKSGDQACYFEIDSFLPERPEFEFLRKSCFRTMGDDSGFRIKTIRLRKQLSQGLLLPLSVFGLTGSETSSELEAALGVKKWDPPLPACLAGEAKGFLPGFIRKTDQERVQNLVELIARKQGEMFEATEKLDGSSCSYYHKDGEVGVCSRNLELKETEGNTLWKISNELSILERLKTLGRNLALQGEVCGPGIQKNRYGLKTQRFFVFDIWDIDRKIHLTTEERIQILLSLGGFDHVPILGSVVLDGSVDDILAAADGKSALADTPREGIVFKAMKEFGGEIVSFKAISNAFLEKEKD